MKRQSPGLIFAPQHIRPRRGPCTRQKPPEIGVRQEHLTASPSHQQLFEPSQLWNLDDAVTTKKLCSHRISLNKESRCFGSVEARAEKGRLVYLQSCNDSVMPGGYRVCIRGSRTIRQPSPSGSLAHQSLVWVSGAAFRPMRALRALQTRHQ